MELQQLQKQQFDKFRNFLYQKSGIWINDNKISLLSNRIRRRLKEGPFADFDAYYRHLTSPQGAGELEHFLDAVTTNETFFFRTQHHFDWLKSDFIAQAVLAERRGQREKSLRIWSAGCATGAEPYTIGICLLENRFRLRDWSLTIVGTDISEEVLRTARLGVFNPRAVEGLSEQQMRRYFQNSTEDDTCTVRAQLKELVVFKQHNLMTPMPRPLFDCIFIRNVLIYFDRESKRTVIQNLMSAMAPGAFLVVGPSEGIYDMLDGLQKHSAFLYQKPAS